MTSDHSPVFATFEVGVMSQFVPKKGKGASQCLTPEQHPTPLGDLGQVYCIPNPVRMSRLGCHILMVAYQS